MNLQEFYESVNSDYKTILARQKNDGRIKKFLSLIKSDTSYTELKTSIGNHDYTTACKALNSLKSLALNLSLDSLQESTEALERNLKCGAITSDTDSLFEFVSQDYQKILNSVKQLNLGE